MTDEKPTRLERKLAKDLKKEVRHEEVALHKHLKHLEKAEHHRKQAEHLREELAHLQIKALRLEEKIREHEVRASELEGVPIELRDRV
jgi:hypothetical protein